ncbi:hypothetical protein [Polynucleobacter arcticus]|uniref:Uncharacterized protein n=1 Tax=Polynucleobacter arcticus TaxID=1743165 RepID=A0A6M9PMD5_9BURK|nr:hypothetical protein [Polynucleobacter arcticus]QKM60085.1 hypothetical protein DN92_02990 [Polynucleobacter arcticus]
MPSLHKLFCRLVELTSSLRLGGIQNCILLFPISIVLIACNKNQLPEYWLCKGNTQQESFLSNGDLQSVFSGKDQMLIEKYERVITQYVSKPFTGVYQVCLSNDTELIFKMGSCDSSEIKKDDWNTAGKLNKKTLQLQMTEESLRANILIKGSGQFTCQYLGNKFPSTIFYVHEEI